MAGCGAAPTKHLARSDKVVGHAGLPTYREAEPGQGGTRHGSWRVNAKARIVSHSVSILSRSVIPRLLIAIGNR